MFDRDELQRLAATMYDIQIASIYGCDRTTVSYWRKKFGIPPKHRCGGRPRTVCMDVDFFSSIDTESKAYILGLLSADGCVHKDGRSLSIGLKAEDEHILHDIRSALSSNATLSERTSCGGHSIGSRIKILNLSSKKLVADLAKYGVVPRKSFTLTFPDLPSHLARHYIRGIWDGDGHVGRRNFSVIGTEALLQGIKNSILAHLNITLSYGLLKGSPRLVGYRRDRPVLHWLYGDSTIFLRRKHRVYAEFWS